MSSEVPTSIVLVPADGVETPFIRPNDIGVSVTIYVYRVSIMYATNVIDNSLGEVLVSIVFPPRDDVAAS
jgi:hypothetical protein